MFGNKFKNGELLCLIFQHLILISLILSFYLSAHESWEPTAYSSKDTHAPTPLPDRVVLTWEEDPVTTQSVSGEPIQP